ncbi:MAG: hypothetical protein A4E55_01939 [Pelotomaculum sp. PtaU1.Bin035]|nr:MAG: hypothetical protein A4E55_01939 [Pelotomaculum sp. PtaU1.Bin035]
MIVDLKDEEEIQMKYDAIEPRKNNTGMPDNLKAGLETLSGFDLSDVRVHSNSDKPSQVGALGYTQGTDIYIAPGQEKHLPHEGWHVVQQMQGRVKPTLVAEGMAINNDQDLEREASDKGLEANQLRNDSLLKKSPKPAVKQLQLNFAGDVIQRAVGFEMQTTMPVSRESEEPYGYKTLIYEDKRINPTKPSFYKITVDHDDVLVPQQDSAPKPETMEVIEFELPPIDDESAMERTAGRMEIMRTALKNATQAATHAAKIQDVIANYEGLLTTKFPLGSGEDYYDAIDRNSGIKQADAIVGLEGGNWKHHMAVRPQATFGVLLEDLSSTLTAILSNVNLVEEDPVREKLLELIAQIKERIPVEGKLLGLITLVEVYLALMGNEKQFEYPKNAAPFMARTDFHSMFNTLSGEEQRNWSEGYVKANEENYMKENVFGGGFKQSSGGVSKGPNRYAWMISIANPNDKDKAYSDYLLRYVQAGLVEDLKYILQKLSQEELVNALESGEQTPQKELAVNGFKKLTANKVPSPEEMHAIVDVVNVQELHNLVDGAYMRATQELQNPTKDLMSMGPVTRRVGSMGSMTVSTDVKSKEKDMAILENRFMPDWDSAPNPDEDIKWDVRLIDTFRQLQAILEKKKE